MNANKKRRVVARLWEIPDTFLSGVASFISFIHTEDGYPDYEHNKCTMILSFEK